MFLSTFVWSKAPDEKCNANVLYLVKIRSSAMLATWNTPKIAAMYVVHVSSSIAAKALLQAGCLL